MLLTENLRQLPQDRYLIMRVVYNDKTPLEYTPKHFVEAADTESSDSSQDTLIGSIVTPHHIFRLKISTSNSDENEKVEEKEVGESDCEDVPKAVAESVCHR